MSEILLSTLDARKALGNCGRTKLYGLLAVGKLKAVKLGARTLITEESLKRLVAELPTACMGAHRGVRDRGREKRERTGRTE